MDSESESSSDEEQTIYQSLEALSFNNNGNNTVEPVDSDKGKGFEDLQERVNQMTTFMKTKDFSSMLSRLKNLEDYSKSISKERDGIRPRFYIRFLVELENYIHEVWENRKLLAKKNREDLDTAKKKLQKISKILARDLAKYRENPDPDLSGGDGKEIAKNNNENASASEEARWVELVEVDSWEMDEPMLPYDSNVDTFGDRILKINSRQLTYEEAFLNRTYRGMALHSKKSSYIVPVQFTQFVLRKLAVNAIFCSPFVSALHPQAEEYLLKLIGPQHSVTRQVHPRNVEERPSIFRSSFTKLFCQKVISNLQNADLKCDKLHKLAQVFPFRICKKVPKYEIDVSTQFKDDFYDRMQSFLDENFDKHVPVRETIALFLNHIHHFFKTEFSSEDQRDQYMEKFPRLNDKGIVHFQNLYNQYRNVRNYFKNCKLQTRHLDYEKEDFQKLPEKNMDEMAFLLRSTEFCTKRRLYEGIFQKYLFFFVHTLEVKKHKKPVFFIDNMVYQCLNSLRKFRTLREDLQLVNDIVMITLLGLLGHKAEIFHSEDYLIDDSDRYSINLKTLRNIKMYITTLVSKENKNVQFNFEYKTDLFCEFPFLINNKICFDVSYSGKKNNCQKGIMYFLRRLICCVLSPKDISIRNIVCYSAFLGQENKYVIPENIVESVRNFIRLSNRRALPKTSPSSLRDEYRSLLRGLISKIMYSK